MQNLRKNEASKKDWEENWKEARGPLFGVLYPMEVDGVRYPVEADSDGHLVKKPESGRV